ncbi:hypothetical protein HG535_0F01070 [Zygotorulaspora mrakii]|uniref:DH domain-containing protein n=1 Tax=Zygotorulaspora mrakii TaxID=42260 RepID=A0A7H9B4X8_ZYGMR|nr:uncharacterized protein HG535_0F01070 [Zygotorulaspora mrakii]QLG73597.1 hypothetical protein HG535_0F01070 [Zygotorulaspora mrakii]
MYKTSRFIEQINCPGTSSLTPIRDYENDFFHINDDKLPSKPKNTYKKANLEPLLKKKGAKSNKRPASLVLAQFPEPVNKKQCSPLYSNDFKELAKVATQSPIKSDPNSKISEFIRSIKLLYDNEVEYAKMMELSNSVYRKNLNENPAFKAKLLGVGSHNEISIFGNIETIASISRLFLNSLQGALVDQKFKEVDELFWEEIDKKSTLQEKLAKNLDIGKIFNLNFLRIKSTYLTYFVTHRKQMEFLDYMRVGNEKLFEKWYKHCFTLANNNKLEDIFELPIKRLSEWTLALEKLCILTKDELFESCIRDNIRNTLEQYRTFEKYVENEISEFNGTVNYDFSLTPIEIIQSYGLDNVNVHTPLQNSNEKAEKDHKKGNKRLTCNSIKTFDRSTRTVSIFSGSSSRYSEYDIPSTIDASVQSTNSSSNLTSDSNILWDSTISDLTLCDHVENFKKVHRGLSNLKKILGKDDMISVLDIHLKHAALWGAVIECDGENIAIQEDATFFFSSMHNEYINKLQRLREDVAVMKVTEMETLVKKPLVAMLKCCDSVKAQLHDLNVLKRDYMVYLREKRSSLQDMKREILANHFKKLQAKLLHDLPIFMDLVYRTTSLVILNYHKMMQKYLEITAGGELFLIKDLERLGHLRKDAGRNFDILQSYSTSRFCSKRYVRDNWFFEQDQTESRILRKLFEL